MRIHASDVALLALLLAGCGDSGQGPAGYPADVDVAAPVLSAEALRTFAPRAGALLYVPAYSSIYNATAHRELLLTVTLSVRNTDPEHAVVLRSARYYDTAGNLLRETVPVPRLLPPLATYSYVVDLADASGGSGANFLVHWEAEAANVAEPLVETVHMQTLSGHGVSFTSRAVVVKRTIPGGDACGGGAGRG